MSMQYCSRYHRSSELNVLTFNFVKIPLKHLRPVWAKNLAIASGECERRTRAPGTFFSLAFPHCPFLLLFFHSPVAALK